MSAAIPTIQTADLILRPLQATDAEVLYRIYQVEGVLQYFPSTTPPPLEKVERFVAGQEKHWAQYGYGNWGVLPKDGNEIIGWVGLQFLPETNETEVGYLLNRPFWGKGYATQAARAALDFGFERFNFVQIIGLTHPDNLASQRVLEKCGLTFIERRVYWGLEMKRFATV